MAPLLKTSLFSLVLAILKLIAFLTTGSMVVIASVVDSFSDAILSYLNHRMSELATESADSEHPFGHGGFEVVSSIIQGFIIVGAGVIIIVESLSRLILSGHHSNLTAAGFPFALGTLVFSAFAGLLIHLYLNRHRRTLQQNNRRSLALDADHAHYLSDFVLNLTSAGGLIAVYYWDSFILDASFGILGGVLIGRTGFPILRKSLRDILHTRVDPTEQKKIVAIAAQSHSQVVGVHRLRSRRLGPTLFVDFHLKLPKELNLQEAHAIGEVVQKSLRAHYPQIDVIIHLDPDNEPDDEIFEPAYL